MPLLDHFHEPILDGWPWESFHGVWCPAMLEALNEVLPPRFRGRVNIHLGPRIAADVAEFDQEAGSPFPSTANGHAGKAVALWAPPAVAATCDVEYPDDIEVQVVVVAVRAEDHLVRTGHAPDDGSEEGRHFVRR